MTDDGLSDTPHPGWRRPVSGGALERRQDLDHLARYLRRARYLKGISQQRLAEESGVSQSTISRLELASAPAMRLDSLAALARELGRTFPFGFCPHDHPCAWQPVRPPPPIDPERQRIRDLLIERGLDFRRPGRGD